MMKLNLFCAVPGMFLGLAVWCASAQTEPGTNTPTTSRTTTTRIISDSEVKENISPTTDIDQRPPRQERPALSTEVKDRLRAFERAREAYLEKQRELEKRWKGATEEEREKIREQMKERLQSWREQHKQFNEDMRERLREVKRELPSLRKALDESRPSTRPGLD